MKTGLSLFLCLLLSATAYAGKDAAIEAQEGNVDHWIKFYEKERGIVGVPAAVEPKSAISEQNDPKQRQSDTAPIVRPSKTIDHKHD